MAPLTAQQLKIISTICSVMHIKGEDKETMVNGFSAGRCTSSKGLYFDEAKALIHHLQQLQGQQTIKPGTKAMLGKMLSYAREMGWTVINPNGKTVADFRRLEEWALKFGYQHKKINAYEYDELPKLVTQFELVYKSFLTKF